MLHTDADSTFVIFAYMRNSGMDTPMPHSGFYQYCWYFIVSALGLVSCFCRNSSVENDDIANSVAHCR